MRAYVTSVRTTELRKGNRYRLNAPVQFLWSSQDGVPHSGQGVTRDINTTGVYVQVNVFPPAGSRIQMEILLPGLSNARHGMHLSGEGIVIRTEPRRPACEGGFAAEVQFYPETQEGLLSHLSCSSHAG
jgi:hypothetical protein